MIHCSILFFTTIQLDPQPSLLFALFPALLPALLLAQNTSASAQAQKPEVVSPSSTAEAHASELSTRPAILGSPALRAFLYRMPKGGDLHNHLSGAIYAESSIRAAAEDHLCITTQSLAFDKTRERRVQIEEIPRRMPRCSISIFMTNCRCFSMRTFVPKSATHGHDQFFGTFDRFGGPARPIWRMAGRSGYRAAAQNEQYLELMDTPDFKHAAALAVKIGFSENFAQYRQHLLAGIKDGLPAIRERYNLAETDRKQREHCGTPSAEPACNVEIRFIYQVLRGQPPPVVFAQLVQGFEAASIDPAIVGINLVQPEDGYIAIRDYRLQMRMLDALHRVYPKVHITLHAGELAFGMVPPDGLSFHIRSAIEEGHAERIGHGVDIMYEDRPYELLKEMAARHIMVEINLTSNDVILNVKGKDHPFMLYRKYGVPVALSTDDEGVSRIDLTHEYQRAAETYPLSYRDLKEMARTSLEHAFLPGDSLWERTTPEILGRPVAVCAGQVGRQTPSGACAQFMAGSEKAQQQWELERRFQTFEESF